MIAFLRAPMLSIVFREKPGFVLVTTERGRRLPGGTTLRRRQRECRTEELVAATVTEDGAVLNEFAWPARAVVFQDRPVDGRLTGGRGTRKATTSRRIALPIRPRARFVVIYREAPERGVPVRKPLAALWLRRSLTDRRPEVAPPVPGLPELPEPIAVSFILRRLKTRRFEAGDVDGADPEFRGGVLRVGSLRPRASLASSFDVVVVAEGFHRDELGAFEKQAELLMHGFLSSEPFASVREHVNFHTVHTYSRDSGISNYPIGGPAKRTMFGFVNDYENTDTNGNYGTPFPELVRETVTATVGRWSEIDLVIVIVNCEAGSGHAYPEHRMIAVARSRKATDQGFVDLALHEAGHVVGNLCDEYVSGIAWSPEEVYPNLATQAEVNGGKVPWWPLTLPAERAGDRLKLVFTYGGPVDDERYREPVLPPEQYEMLGAFWGCQFADPPRDNPTVETIFHDPRGRSFYRPMARCRMRRLDAEFCRACAAALRQAIESVAARSRKEREAAPGRTRERGPTPPIGPPPTGPQPQA